jgi:hypothetical protein
MSALVPSRARSAERTTQTIRLPGSRIPIDRTAAEHIWDSGLCTQTDPEVFFPDKGQSPERARQICHRCPVAALCLPTFGPVVAHGVVGGLTHRERQQRRARTEEVA